jgi:hypothetical protein
VTGTPGSGSTNNFIPLFNVEVLDNGGADFTYTDSATLGGHFRIVTPGIYQCVASMQLAGAGQSGSVARGAALSNTLSLTAVGDVYPLGVSSQLLIVNLAGFFNCAADDYVHCLTSLGVINTNIALFKFGLFGPF